MFIEFTTVNIHSLYSICRKLRSRLYLNTSSDRKICIMAALSILYMSGFTEPG